MLDSEATTKTQALILIVIIVTAALGGVATYLLLSEQDQSSETVKIGVLTDVDGYMRGYWQEIVLACEELNAEGGILGRQVEVIPEDCFLGFPWDSTEVSTALNRLIDFHQVDFIIGGVDDAGLYAAQELIAEKKKIYLSVLGTSDQLTQNVLDDYDKYKYWFSFVWNASSVYQGITDSLLLFREMSGFNKIGYLVSDVDVAEGIAEGLDTFLPENGFDLVYKKKCPMATMDFSSYFAAAETAGVEVLVPLIMVEGIPFVKEYHDRQSPIVIYTGVISGTGSPDSWEWTEGKCNYVTIASGAVIAGYPLTSKTIPFREAYINRWNEVPGGGAYDAVRYILPDAIERAGTIETEAVVKALEEISIETTAARNFFFTPAHCIMMGEDPNDPEADYPFAMLFQWQNEEMVPVYPQKIMEEAEATYIYPDWSGPWDEQ